MGVYALLKKEIRGNEMELLGTLIFFGIVYAWAHHGNKKDEENPLSGGW